MSIFDRIKSAIFGNDAQAATRDDVAATTTAPVSSPRDEPQVTATPINATDPSVVPATSGAQAPAAPAPQATTSASTSVDVAPILDQAVAKSGQKLDWRRSIVDLMKALGMDASLAERKELAQELGYTGDMGDSAAMNMWLHRALMQKLSANGGKVPAELLD